MSQINLNECQTLVDELQAMRAKRDEVVNEFDEKHKEVEGILLVAGFTSKKVVEMIGNRTATTGQRQPRGTVQESVLGFLNEHGPSKMRAIVGALPFEKANVATTLQYLKARNILALDKVTHLWSVVPQ